jgi:hypothetical protein
MTWLHTNFHMPIPIASLVIAIEPKTENRIHAATSLFLQRTKITLTNVAYFLKDYYRTSFRYAKWSGANVASTSKDRESIFCWS